MGKALEFTKANWQAWMPESKSQSKVQAQNPKESNPKKEMVI